MTTRLNWEDDDSQGGLLNSRSSQRCLSETEVEDFLFNRLSGTTREVIEEHLLVCAACQDMVEKEEGYVSAMQAAVRRLESEQLERAWNGVKEDQRGRAWFSSRGLGFALVGLAAALAVGVFVLRTPQPMGEAEISLAVERNVTSAPAARAGQALKVSLDLQGLPGPAGYAVEVVDQNGAAAKKAQVEATGVLRIGSGLPAGRYWVRVLGADGGLLREFSLLVK
ncbi:MAG: zf-HC2 domain-containing protein [Acidobacteria bacterium]|nr:zf-HC2 domain-containing protein [Acidobacteriota bacterium]